MSDHPPGPPQDPPDPARDATGNATGDAHGTLPAVEVATPDDLPDGRDDSPGQRAPAGAPAYDMVFGRETSAEPSWVPQRSGPPPLGHAPPGPGSPMPPAARTLDLSGRGGGRATRRLGGRLQPWHVVAIAAGLLVPAGFWAVSSLGDGLDPVARATAAATRIRPTVTRPVTVPPRSATLPAAPGAASPPTPTRSAQTAPPRVVKVPDIPVTPIPTDARTIRFESYAAGGARVEVSLSDARHTRYDYPVRNAPFAFETPLAKNASSNDYYSLRVRLYDPAGSGDLGAVSCRILVDGIVVTSQQGRGSTNCYISPYYDIQRR
ncbi:hypothetical protein [Terrabacter sp. 2RAF25]|uniref:hypothetical protein n=1 Tax=Terrabacter sp. 2RAF25 TaxID=3232998 RepID=UPI003F99FEB1